MRWDAAQVMHAAGPDSTTRPRRFCRVAAANGAPPPMALRLSWKLHVPPLSALHTDAAAVRHAPPRHHHARCRALRQLVRLLYQRTRVELLRLWQPQQHTAGDGSLLRIRWRATAQPWWILPWADDEQNLEVLSTYKFDSRGRVYEHVVDSLVPPEPPLVFWPALALARAMAGGGEARPRARGPEPRVPVPGMIDGPQAAEADAPWPPGEQL